MNAIQVQKRDPAAKAKQLRHAGIVPCVIYGGDLKEAVSIQLPQTTARQLAQTSRNGSKMNLTLDGKTYPVLIKELDYNPMEHQVVQISFEILKPDRKYRSVADIVFINKDKVQGILEQMQTQVPHSALPEFLLDTVTVDLKDIKVGDTLTIGDIKEFQSDKIELHINKETAVLHIRDRVTLADDTEETEETKTAAPAAKDTAKK